MFLFRKPSPDTIERVLTTQVTLPFSYPHVGQTVGVPPRGYIVDHNRAQLGRGEEVFQRARAAIQRWEMFNLGWVRSYPASAPIEVGSTVAIVARLPLLWSINVCRIIYVVDTDGQTVRYGFAYGALPKHAQQGEERFLVEWRRDDDSVWFDILAFSRPQSLLARLAYPLGRLMQRRFARSSLKAMQRVVQASS